MSAKLIKYSLTIVLLLLFAYTVVQRSVEHNMANEAPQPPTKLVKPATQPNVSQYNLDDSLRGLNVLDFETCYALCVDFLAQYYAAMIEGEEIDLSPYSSNQDFLEDAKKKIVAGTYQFPKEITDINYGLMEIKWNDENKSVVLSLALKVTLDYGGGFGTEHQFTIQSQGDALIIAHWIPFEKGQRDDAET